MKRTHRLTVAMLSDVRHFVAERIVKPRSEIRGTGRVAGILNRWFLRLCASPIVTTRMRDGTRLKIDLRGQEFGAFWSGVYEPAWFPALARFASLGGNVLDVGANIGFFSVAVGKQLQVGHQIVYAFEPVAANFARLLENVSLNGLQARISAHSIGLSDCSREAAIILREDFQAGANTGNASIAISSEADQGFSVEKVTLVTLDAFARRTPIENVSVVQRLISTRPRRIDFSAERVNARTQRPVIFLESNKTFYQW